MNLRVLRFAPLVLALLVAAPALTGCFPGAFGIEVVKPPPEEPDPIVPDKYVGEAEPALVPSKLDGFKAAPTLDPRLYFGVEDKQWYRFTMNRWFLAFTWDGNWFPVELEEVPAPLRALTPSFRESYGAEVKQKKKSREEQLKELDQQLRDLEKAP